MREKDIIKKYFSPLSINAKGADGLDDDIAVLGNIGSGLLAINMDSLVAGTHFFENDDPTILAQKCLRVNISDLAAKGAIPFGYFLSLALPNGTDEVFIENFTDGLRIDQRNYKLSLLGGDTVKTSGPLTITITILGLLQASTVPRRSSANIDDDIYVTGTIGDGALGLLAHCDYKGENPISIKLSRHLGHYLCPEPRVEMHQIISKYASASMDISDGFLGDLETLICSSDVGAEIAVNAVPLSDDTKFIMSREHNVMPIIFTGGDDYEILFTANKKDRKNISNLAKKLPFKLTKIGTINKSKKLTLLDPERLLKLNINDFSHSHNW